MEHYFLFIFPDGFSIEEQKSAIKHANSLLTSENTDDYLSSVAPILKPFVQRKAVFIANVLISTNETCNWFETSQSSLISETVFKKSEINSKSRDNSKTLNVSSSNSISEVLHFLANQLPMHDRFFLDVFSCASVLKDLDLDLDKHIQLGGALRRLNCWHNASLSLICDRENIENSTIKEWCEIIGCRVIRTEDILQHIGLIWRGGIDLVQTEQIDPLNVKKFELVIDSGSLGFSDLHKCNSDNKMFKKSSFSNDFLLTSDIEILSECDLSTIPSFVISPIIFRLCLATHKNCNTESHSLLQYMSKRNVGCIVRLKYSVLKKVLPTNNALTTENWKKAVLSGNISRSKPKSNVILTQHLTFVTAKNFNNSPGVLLHFFDFRNVKAIFCKELNFTPNCMVFPTKLASKTENTNILENTNFIDSNLLRIKIQILRELSKETLEGWKEYKKDYNGEEDITETEANYINSAVFNAIDSKFKFESKNIPSTSYATINDSDEMDPSDWPERLLLLSNQIQADKENSMGSLAGFSPPIRRHKSDAISVKDIQQFFSETGDCKNSRTLTPIQTKKKISLSSCSLEHVTKADWNESKFYNFHDIYYNSAETREDEEEKNSEIQKLYVNDETASAYTRDKIALNSISVKPCKRKLSVESRNMESNKRKIMKPSEISSQIMHKHVQNNRRKSMNNIAVASPFLHTHIRTGSVPLRRSPRKPLNKNPEQKASSAPQKHNEFSEKHKMKLREAVVYALEKQGIEVNHKLFKPCARKLFAVCKPFVKDVIGKGNTTDRMKSIAESHVKQVVDFEIENAS